MSKYLITGGAGFVGSHLIEMCLRLGHRVCCLDNCSNGGAHNVDPWSQHSHFEFVKEEVTNRAVLRRCVEDADVVVHLASEAAVRCNKERNSLLASQRDATSILLEEAATGSTRVVLISSEHVYLSLANPLSTADRSIGFASPDSPNRGQAVSLARDAVAPTTVARLFPTIGPRQNSHYGSLVLQLFQQALAGRNLTVPGNGLRKRSYVYITDVVHWLLLLSQSNEAIGQVYDLGSPWMVCDLDLARKIGRVTDAPVEIEHLEDSEAFFERQTTQPDINKVKGLTAFTPRIQLDEALRRIHEWLLSNPPNETHLHVNIGRRRRDGHRVRSGEMPKSR